MHTIATYVPPQNQRDIILDITENISQIANWSHEDANDQRGGIALYFKLTDKDIEALDDKSVSHAFQPAFGKFRADYAALEAEYRAGITNQREWSERMRKLASVLTENLHLL